MFGHSAASGEATGELTPILERAADNLSHVVERCALVLTTLLDPLLILAIDGMPFPIALVELMPIIESRHLGPWFATGRAAASSRSAPPFPRHDLQFMISLRTRRKSK